MKRASGQTCAFANAGGPTAAAKLPELWCSLGSLVVPGEEMLKAAGLLALGFAAGVGATVFYWPVPLTMYAQRAPAAAAPAEITPPDAVLPAETAKPDEDAFEVLTADPLGELDMTARLAIMRWMAANPQYEFVVYDYCRCRVVPPRVCPDPQADIERADYPYLEMRDFNKDGRKDIAIILALKSKQVPHAFLVFNGPFGDDLPKAAFSTTGLARNDIVYNGFLGPTESDNGWTFERKGKTYELKYQGDPF